MVSLFLSFMLLLGEHNHSPPINKYELSPKQERCLFRNIWHEGRSQTALEQIWIAQTTINRVGSEDFPDSICGVVHQKNAFSWYHQIPKNKHKVQPANILEQKAYDQIKFVIEIIKLLNTLDVDLTDGSLFYYKAGTKKPRYLKNATLIKVVGGHKFYKLKEKTEW